MIGNGFQRRTLAAHNRIGIVEGGLLFRMLRDVGIKLGTRQIGRIHIGARGLRRRACERLIFADQIVAPAVDHQHAPQLSVRRLAAGRQRTIERKSRRVALLPEKFVQHAGSTQQLVNHLPLLRRQCPAVEGHRHFAKP